VQVDHCAPGLITLGEVGSYFGGLSAVRFAECLAHSSVQPLTPRTRQPGVGSLTQQAMTVAVASGCLFQDASLQALVETVENVALGQRDETAQQPVINILSDNCSKM
jgi:hypothetical protein